MLWDKVGAHAYSAASSVIVAKIRPRVGAECDCYDPDSRKSSIMSTLLNDISYPSRALVPMLLQHLWPCGLDLAGFESSDWPHRYL